MAANGDTSSVIKAHTDPFPEDLWNSLLEFCLTLPGKTPPVFEDHHRAIKVRHELLHITKKCAIQIVRMTREDDPKLPLWKTRQEMVDRSIAWIEGWGAAEKAARENAEANDLVLPSVGRLKLEDDSDAAVQNGKGKTTTRDDKDLNQNDTMISEQWSEGESSQEKGVRVLIKVHLEGPRDPNGDMNDEVFKSRITVHSLPYKTPISTILRIIGATDPKRDFLDFSDSTKEIIRDRNGIPFVIPIARQKIGWPGGRWADGQKINLGELIGYKAPSKRGSGNRPEILECSYKRRWMEVEDIANFYPVSGNPRQNINTIINRVAPGLPTACEHSSVVKFNGFLSPEAGNTAPFLNADTAGHDCPPLNSLEWHTLATCNMLISLQQKDKHSFKAMRELIGYLNQEVLKHEKADMRFESVSGRDSSTWKGANTDILSEKDRPVKQYKLNPFAVPFTPLAGDEKNVKPRKYRPVAIDDRASARFKAGTEKLQILIKEIKDLPRTRTESTKRHDGNGLESAAPAPTFPESSEMVESQDEVRVTEYENHEDPTKASSYDVDLFEVNRRLAARASELIIDQDNQSKNEDFTSRDLNKEALRGLGSLARENAGKEESDDWWEDFLITVG